MVTQTDRALVTGQKASRWSFDRTKLLANLVVNGYLSLIYGSFQRRREIKVFAFDSAEKKNQGQFLNKVGFSREYIGIFNVMA